MKEPLKTLKPPRKSGKIEIVPIQQNARPANSPKMRVGGITFIHHSENI